MTDNSEDTGRYLVLGLLVSARDRLTDAIELDVATDVKVRMIESARSELEQAGSVLGVVKRREQE